MSIVEIIVNNWVAIFILIAVCLVVASMPTRPRGAPPGPWGLPIVGNLHQLGSNGDMRQVFKELRHKYGDVFSLHFGNKLVVVLNGNDVIREAFVKHGSTFSDRPKVFVVDEVMNATGLILSTAESSKELRKFCLKSLRGLGFGKVDMEQRIQEEVSGFLQTIENNMNHPLDPTHAMQTSVSNIICSIVLGKLFDYNDPEFKEILKMKETIFQTCNNVVNFIPWLRFFPGDPFKFQLLLKTSLDLSAFLKDFVMKRIESKNDDSINDFTDALLKEMRERQALNQNFPFGIDELQSIIGDFFIAGTESISTTLLWAIIYMIRHPEVQNKVQDEINACVVTDRMVSLKDRAQLKYTEATIMEIQRHANVVPFSVPHSASEDAIFRGFDIPAQCIIIPNMESVLHDPHIFPNPEEFRPSRFLDTDGNLIQPEAFIPFSTGRRNCIGESLAKMELFLYFSAMLKSFTFTSPKNTPPPSLMEFTFGVTVAPKPFKVCISKGQNTCLPPFSPD